MKPSQFVALRHGCLFAAAFAASPAAAQDRSTENAVAEAEDGFGIATGRESLGVYSANSTRGFSPNAAGNVRIDGLYFDPATQLSGLIADSTTIRVGLSAQGYPFAAPSGIADTSVRRPDFAAGASIIATGDSFGSGGFEVTGALPLARNLALGFGLSANATEYSDGTSSIEHAQAIVLRWQPSESVEIVPFWTLSNIYDNEAGPLYIPTGNSLPPMPPRRHFDGPQWVDGRSTDTNAGLIATIRPAKGWKLRFGAFRSVSDQKSGYTNLIMDVEPDGSARQLIFADPRLTNISWSGEARLSREWGTGTFRHEVVASVRARFKRRQFGGDDAVDLGPVTIGERQEAPKPAFEFGPVTNDRIRQVTPGLSYALRWKGVGEFGVGLSRTDYRKTTTIPEQAAIARKASPWLWNASGIVTLSPSLSLYAGYARGLEESGLAPSNAVNRNEPLPAIITSQRDAGLRWSINPNLKLIAGVFDLRRPYFGYAPDGRFEQIGTTRNQGLEFSLAGAIGENIDLVAGGVIFKARVERKMPNGIKDERPFAIPTHLFNVNLNWRTPWLQGLSFDASASFRGNMAASSQNDLFLPSRTLVNLGSRYRFRLADNSATLRLQVINLFDHRTFGLAGPESYVAQNGRYFSGSLALDI